MCACAACILSFSIARHINPAATCADIIRQLETVEVKCERCALFGADIPVQQKEWFHPSAFCLLNKVLRSRIAVKTTEYKFKSLPSKQTNSFVSTPYVDCSYKILPNMTLDILEENMSGKAVSKAVLSVLRRARAEKRLTFGLLPAIKLLEKDPCRALFCVLPYDTQGDAAFHIHTVLLQAFCYENDIHIIQVDSADKLRDIVGAKGGGNTVGSKTDLGCVVVHQPWSSDQPVLSKSEQQLVRFCHQNFDEVPQPVIKLPAL